MRKFIDQVIHLQNSGIVLTILLWPLALCAALFNGIVQARSFCYRVGIFKQQNLPCTVISIGNLTVGGTGKTPLVCHVARYIKDAGCRVAILSRGYGVRRHREPLIVSDGKNLLSGPERAGDEAVMLAKKLADIPVLVGKNRFLLGQRALQDFSVQVLILDDGFQHYQLKRDVDIVLINARNPFGNGYLLPRGILREHIAALGRAQVVVITKVTETAPVEKIKEVIKRHNPQARIFTATLCATALRRVCDNTVFPVQSGRGKTAIGICSIGDPGSFFSMLETFGFILLQKLVFPDHHRYNAHDYATINTRSQEADFIVTTEKDIAKINFNMIKSKKLFILETALCINQEVDFFKTLAACAELPIAVKKPQPVFD
jgi:tetraacyldisaccharide 4'-kinase